MGLQVKLAVLMLSVWACDAQDTCPVGKNLVGECDFPGFCAAGTDNTDCCSTRGLLGPFENMKLDRTDLVESEDLHGVEDCAAECAGNPDYRSFNWLGAYGPHGWGRCWFSTHDRSSAAADYVPDAGMDYYEVDTACGCAGAVYAESVTVGNTYTNLLASPAGACRRTNAGRGGRGTPDVEYIEHDGDDEAECKERCFGQPGCRAIETRVESRWRRRRRASCKIWVDIPDYTEAHTTTQCLLVAGTTRLDAVPGYTLHTTGGCSARNELGSDERTLDACADACTSDLACVSFEYDKDGITCQRSSSCNERSMTVQDSNDPMIWYLRDIQEGELTVEPFPIPELLNSRAD
jgi:hypothetical protein